MKPVNIIVAVDLAGGFAKDGQIPWDIKEDLRHFKETTTGGVCIMGRRTYEDIANRKLPAPGDDILPGRESFVISRDPDFAPAGAVRVAGMNEAISALDFDDKREIFVIGGELLFREALPFAKRVIMTVVNDFYDCDKFFDVKYVDKYFNIVRVMNKDGRIVSGTHKSKDNFLFFEYHRARV